MWEGSRKRSAKTTGPWAEKRTVIELAQNWPKDSRHRTVIGNPCGSVQVVEEIGSLIESGLGVMDDFGFGCLEGLFRRNALEPLLKKMLFVIRKIETDEKANTSV